jgi:bla regulator protein BlaR1
MIGQRADGAVVMVAIDGRQGYSIGVTFEDCINIMLEHNAIVAANLDGGSSSVMYYNGEIINNVVSMNGERLVPTAWVVK